MPGGGWREISRPGWPRTSLAAVRSSVDPRCATSLEAVRLEGIGATTSEGSHAHGRWVLAPSAGVPSEISAGFAVRTSVVQAARGYGTEWPDRKVRRCSDILAKLAVAWPCCLFE